MVNFEANSVLKRNEQNASTRREQQDSLLVEATGLAATENNHVAESNGMRIC